jgi:hypothetical protein
MKNIYNSTRFWKLTTISLFVLFILNRSSGSLFHFKNTPDSSALSIVEPAQASEIHPMFTCPCCGMPLNKEEPCCGAMVQIIDFIDQKVSEGLSKDEVILETAKEFGIDRLTNEEDQKLLREKLVALAPADAPQIEISEIKRDLGKVSQIQGEVSTDFEFSNQGESNLVINKLSSSCGCTSAAIVYEEKVGPKFTMEGHGQENPKDWQVTIKPDDTAILRVFYDPTIHPDLVGTVTRTVSVFSNDPVNFEAKVTITLEQTK